MPKTQESIIRVGVGVMIIKAGKTPMSQRLSAHGKGEWAFPGGHLEFGESFAQCVRREVMEETGMKIKNIRFQYLANVNKYGNKQYVHIGLTADWQSGQPQQLEPKKHGRWQWLPINKMPKPTFEFCRLAFVSYQTNRQYFDL